MKHVLKFISQVFIIISFYFCYEIYQLDETAQKRKKTCERNLKLYANSVVEYCKAIDKKTGTENFLDCFLELGLGTIVGDCDCLVNGYCD